MVSRRVLAYLSCFSLVAQPLVAQNAPKAAPANAPANQNLSLKAIENESYARILLEWPKLGKNPTKASLKGSLLTLTMPMAVNTDPMVLKQSAPAFIVGAALSADKKIIRLALSKDVVLQKNTEDNIEAFDLVLPNANPPEPFSKHEKPHEENSHSEGEKDKKSAHDGKIYPLKNWPAPKDAPRLKVEAKQSNIFTRIAILGANGKEPIFARHLDRIALTISGIYALDTGNIRSKLPKNVLDAVRYNNETHTSLVMDIEKDAVIRFGKDNDAIYVDILPPGTNIEKIDDATDKLAEKAKEKKEETKTKNHEEGPSDSNPDAKSKGALLLEAAQSELPKSLAISGFEEPAPSGSVIANVKETKPNMVLEFEFEKMAPSAVFRRGGNIFVLFATQANFTVKGFKASNFANSITPVSGEGISGVKISAPDGIFAQPIAIGSKWLVTLNNIAPSATRTIEVKTETAADDNSRIKAIVPDAKFAGAIMDDDVGDKLLIGLAMGPPSALMKSRSFLEAFLPETTQGLAVILRADDLELKPDVDGFVLVRPTGLALSNEGGKSPSGFTIKSPSFVDFQNWRLGPQSDFYKNLAKLKLAASIEAGDQAKGVKAQLDLARFYLAWELSPEALGVIRAIKATKPEYLRAPEVMGLQGAALAMIGRGREALESLSAPELSGDSASHLWAAMAAFSSGDPMEARARFEKGQSALPAFTPEMQALFKLIEAKSAYALEDYVGAGFFAQNAHELASENNTKEEAKLQQAMALAKSGELDKALSIFSDLEKTKDREIYARALFGKAIMIAEKPDGSREEAIRMLDALRYVWRGDDLEIEILRNLGELYIAAGDIRSGLGTLADASTLRPELPSARALRDTLSKQFKYLFLEGGADGMDQVQALALFYDFRQLTPMGPEGDQMARGLADRLVALDLLPQAAELLQHQVDNRLQGFIKSKVATDLAAVYLLDHNPEKALSALWNSRITELPPSLNANRRLIEAIALAELGRNDHALEMIEFDDSSDAARVRAEVHWRKAEYKKSAEEALKTLPAPNTQLDPNAAGEVLRASIASALSGDKANLGLLNKAYGAAMGKTAYSEAFKVVNSDSVPSGTQLKSAIASVHGSSPFGNLIKNLRKNITNVAPPTEGEKLANITGPTDADAAAPDIEKLNARITEKLEEAKHGIEDGHITQAKAAPKPKQQLSNPQIKPAAKIAQAPTKAPVKANNTKPKGIQAPKDPPIVAGR